MACVYYSSPLQDEKMQRVLEFLEKPYKASDKDLAAKVGAGVVVGGGVVVWIV